MRIQLPLKRGGRSDYAKFSVINPGKGLNTLISDSLIDDRESSDLENIQFVESGAPTKAGGYEQVGDNLSNNPKGIGSYVDTSDNKYLLTTDGTALKYLNGSTWTSISGATYSTASTTQINMTQARGKMYIWDGVSGGTELSSLTLSRPGTMPRAKFSIFYNGYHVASGVDTQPSRLYISVGTDASDFTNDTSVTDPTPDNSTDVPGATVFAGTGSGSTIAQMIDVNKNDGDKIMGLAKFGEALIIFKEKSIFQLTFDSSGVPIVAAVTKSYGAVSHRSIENVDNDVFFLSRSGIYVLGNEPNFFNVIRTNELSARVHPILETVSQANYVRATALFFSHSFYLGLPTGTSQTSNNLLLTYDKRFLAFSKWTHLLPECMTTYINSSNQEDMYFTSANSAKVFKYTPSTFSANGSAISCKFTTKAFDLGDFSEYKRWIFADIYFRQFIGQVTIEVLTDGDTISKTSSISVFSSNGIGSYQFGEGTFGGNVETNVSSTATDTNNVPYRIPINKKARTIKLRFTNDRNNETFTVLGYKFSYRNYSPFVFPSEQKLR